jgi:DNA-directed RNA polymerase subunit N (RpoN/RPB10)
MSSHISWCHSCGTSLGNKYAAYERLLSQGLVVLRSDALDLLGVHDACCRNLILTHRNWNRQLVVQENLRSLKNAEQNQESRLRLCQWLEKNAQV